MKKLGLLMLALPMVLSGCAGSIGTIANKNGIEKTNYTLKQGDSLKVIYEDKTDVYSTEKYHNEQIYDRSNYWINGNFDIAISYWEGGIDITIKETGKPTIDFVYRGLITMTLVSYSGDAASTTVQG